MAEYGSDHRSGGWDAPAPPPSSPSAPSGQVPSPTPPYGAVAGETAPPQVDHLRDYREYFSANPGMEAAMRAGLGGSRALDDQGFAAALQETNAFFLANLRGGEEQHFHTRGYTNDPVFAGVAHRLAAILTALKQDNARLEAELHRVRGQQLGAPAGSQPPASREAPQMDTFALEDEMGRLSDLLTSGRLPHERQAAVKARLEELQQQRYGRG